MLEKIQKASPKFNRWLSISVGGFMMLAVTFMMVGSAIMRALTDFSFSGDIEICETMMVWIVLSGLAYALITGAHVRVVLILNRLPSRIRSVFEVFSNTVGLGFFVILTWASWNFFWVALVEMRVPMSPLGVPLFTGAVFLPIGCALISIQFLIYSIVALRLALVPVGEGKVGEGEIVHGV